MRKVICYIEKYVDSANDLSIRTYIKICELYAMSKQIEGLDWEAQGKKLLKCVDKLEVLNDLIKEYSTDKDRLNHWEWSRASYYNYKRKLKV